MVNVAPQQACFILRRIQGDVELRTIAESRQHLVEDRSAVARVAGERLEAARVSLTSDASPTETRFPAPL